MKILIIEDDKDLAGSIAFCLEKEGYLVTMCHDGEEGLYYMQEDLQDLVILDRMLPGLDGISVLRAARAAGVTTPVIFLTALGELQDKIDGLDCGADDYMVKPFAFEELLARIRSSLRRPNQRGMSSLLTLGDVAFDPESLRLTKAKKNAPSPNVRVRFSKFFSAIPVRRFPAPCSFPESGEWTTTWRRETLTITCIFSAAD